MVFGIRKPWPPHNVCLNGVWWPSANVHLFTPPQCAFAANVRELAEKVMVTGARGARETGAVDNIERDEMKNALNNNHEHWPATINSPATGRPDSKCNDNVNQSNQYRISSRVRCTNKNYERTKNHITQRCRYFSLLFAYFFCFNVFFRWRVRYSIFRFFLLVFRSIWRGKHSTVVQEIRWKTRIHALESNKIRIYRRCVIFVAVKFDGISLKMPTTTKLWRVSIWFSGKKIRRRKNIRCATNKQRIMGERIYEQKNTHKMQAKKLFVRKKSLTIRRLEECVFLLRFSQVQVLLFLVNRIIFLLCISLLFFGCSGHFCRGTLAPYK